MFDCIDLPRAKHWDGHTEADAETRLMSLPERKTDGDTINRQTAIDTLMDLNADHRVSWKDAVIDMLDDLPSVQPEPCDDFVKVVRCKKCRYVHCDKEFDNYWCNRMSGTFMVEAEGFCKWGR